MLLNVLRCQLTYYGQAETNAEAWFKALRPRKPEGSLGRTAQDGHLDSHRAPELCDWKSDGLQGLFHLHNLCCFGGGSYRLVYCSFVCFVVVVVYFLYTLT